MSKVVLITGASAGIGRATALYLAQNGYTVYGGARRVDRMEDLRSLGIKPIAMDVTQDESLVACVNHILAEAGRLDILVNNAGYGAYGALEDVPLSSAREQLEVNVFGAMRLTQLVLPAMRQQHYGKIVNVSSVGGKVAFPMGGWYHASKFALEGLSDSLRNEVRGFGIDVIIIEPGATKSEWGGIALDSLAKVSGHTVYQDLAAKISRVFTQNNVKKPEPLVIAQLIKQAIEAKKPKPRYAGGSMASSLLLLRKVLPDRLLDTFIMRQLK